MTNTIEIKNGKTSIKCTIDDIKQSLKEQGYGLESTSVDEPWEIRVCELKDLKQNLNEVERAGYKVQDCYVLPESLLWFIRGRIPQNNDYEEE